VIKCLAPNYQTQFGCAIAGGVVTYTEPIVDPSRGRTIGVEVSGPGWHDLAALTDPQLQAQVAGRIPLWT